MKPKITALIQEQIFPQDCSLCKESSLPVGAKTEYGAVIISKIGNGNNGWFATLSPKTGGDPEEDFTVQINSSPHLTHFCQIANYPGCAENYGIVFARLSKALTTIMAEDNENFKVTADSRETSVSVATYGKSTNWKEKKEHLHLKIFPFRGDIGQPYTVDSSFGKKEVHKDPKTSEEFVKMQPVRKQPIPTERFDYLTQKFISLLN